jgi:hypothetical protein
MNPMLDVFLKEHPLQSQLLERVVDVLLSKPDGTAKFIDIVRGVACSRETRLDVLQNRVTKYIVECCSRSLNSSFLAQEGLFDCVAPGEYRLKCFPNRPHLLNAMAIEFEEWPVQGTWQWFCRVAEIRHHEAWSQTSNETKLNLFAEWMLTETGRELYQNVKCLYEVANDLVCTNSDERLCAP